MERFDPEPFRMPSLETDMEGDFSSLALSDISPRKKVRTPRKILHFSDGTLEEYSTDEEEEDKVDSSITVDPKTLPWGMWMAYWVQHSGSSILSSCDYVGEGLANFLGITSPKYFYEIEDYKRSIQEEQNEKNEETAQMAGWTTGLSDQTIAPDTLQIGQVCIEKNFEIQKDFRNGPISLESKIPVQLNGGENCEKY